MTYKKIIWPIIDADVPELAGHARTIDAVFSAIHNMARVTRVLVLDVPNRSVASLLVAGALARAGHVFDAAPVVAEVAEPARKIGRHWALGAPYGDRRVTESPHGPGQGGSRLGSRGSSLMTPDTAKGARQGLGTDFPDKNGVKCVVTDKS